MTADELVDKITEQIIILNNEPLENFSPDTLSRVGVKLASYKAGLGRYSTIAKKSVWIAEKELKEAKAEEYKKLTNGGVSATAAKELISLGVKEENNHLIEVKELEDKIITLSMNVHDLIDSIKSRLISCQMEKKDVY